MIRKFIIGFFFLFFAGGIFTSLNADDFHYLTVKSSDGNEQSLPLAGLKIVFKNGNMTALSSEGTVTFSLASLSEMFLANNPTSIMENTNAIPGLSYKDGILYISHLSGQTLNILGAGSILVQEKTINNDYESISLLNLPKGIYMVKVNNKVLKVAR